MNLGDPSLIDKAKNEEMPMPTKLKCYLPFPTYNPRSTRYYYVVVVFQAYYGVLLALSI